MPNRTDTIIARGAGALKGVTATIEGLSGVFRTIAKQHAAVRALCGRLEHDPSKRGELWPTIRSELLAHEHAELLVIYPVLRGYAATHAFAERHDRDAGVLERMIAQLDAEPDPTRWSPLFEDLVSAVVAHANLEEHDIFPSAQRAIGYGEAKALDDRYLAAKRAYMPRTAP